MIIYVIESKVNGKKYIGKTTRSVDIRLKEHSKASSLIGEAIEEFGIDNFDIRELEKVTTKKELREKEIHWIKKLNTITPNGYNKCLDDYMTHLAIRNDLNRFYIKRYK